MNSSHSTLTPARHWKDIPQEVSHRAMSSEGRRRMIMATLKAVGIVASLAALAWGGLQVASVLQNGAGRKGGAVQLTPVKDIVLITDGTLDQAWLTRTLMLSKGASLMALDLFELRARLLACGQVLSATLTRNFPATLVVTLSERMPVARVQVQEQGGEARTLLVARDGVVFPGLGFDPKMIETLPWLAGVALTRQGGTFLPLPGMESVAELLAKAKLEAEHLYAAWTKVSLAHLESDGEIEVTTSQGLKITFGTNEDFFRQLANLDAILDAAQAQPDKAPQSINLAVGGQVPVTFEGLSARAPASAASAPRTRPPAKAPMFTGFSRH